MPIDVFPMKNNIDWVVHCRYCFDGSDNVYKTRQEAIDAWIAEKERK